MKHNHVLNQRPGTNMPFMCMQAAASMTALKELDLEDCISLQSLPCKLDTLRNVEVLKMSNFCSLDIAMLVQLLQSLISAVQEWAACRLADMSAADNVSFRAECKDLSSRPHPVSLPSNPQQIRAAGAISCNFLAAIVECGADPALGLLLQSDKAAVQEQAMRAIGNLIEACGDLTEAAKACRFAVSVRVTQTAGTAASANVEQYAKVIQAQLSGLPLVSLLGSDIPAVRGQAVRAVKLLAYCRSNCPSLAAEVAIPALLRLLVTGTPAMQRDAADALSRMAEKRRRAEGVVPALVRLLRSDSAAVKEHAAGVLAHLAAYGHDRAPYAMEELHLALLQLLDSGSSAVQEQAAKALWHLICYIDRDSLQKEAIKVLDALYSTSGEAGDGASLPSFGYAASAVILNIVKSTEPPSEAKMGLIVRVLTCIAGCNKLNMTAEECNEAVSLSIRLLQSTSTLLQGAGAQFLTSSPLDCAVTNTVADVVIPSLVRLLTSKQLWSRSKPCRL